MKRFRGLLILHAALAAFSFYWVVEAPRQIEVPGYLETYQVARALYRFRYPYLPDMSRFEAMAGPYRGSDGTWGADRTLVERWIEEEPEVRHSSPLKTYQKRSFLYEMVVADLWRWLGRESYRAILVLNWAALNLGLALLTLLAWRVTGNALLSGLPAALTGLYTPMLWLAMNAGSLILIFPLGVGLGPLLVRSLTDAKRALLWSALLGAGAGLGTWLHGEEGLWLPLAGWIWLVAGAREALSAKAWRPLALRAGQIILAGALAAALLSPILLYHRKHTGHAFLGIGGAASVMQSLAMDPGNPMGYPHRARALNDYIVSQGYSGPTRWEEDPQDYDLDLFTGEVLRRDLKAHWPWIAREILARPLWLPFPYVYAVYHARKHGVPGHVRYSPPLQMSWRRVPPPHPDLERLGATYRDAGQLQGFRPELRDRPLARAALFIAERPGSVLNKTYVLLLAPALAALAALPLLLFLWNPLRRPELGLASWFLVKAGFFIAIFPGLRYLGSAYGAAFLAGVIGLAAALRPHAKGAQGAPRVLVAAAAPPRWLAYAYRLLGFRAALLRELPGASLARDAAKAFRLSEPLYARIFRERFELQRGPIRLFPAAAEDAFRKALLEELAAVYRLRMDLRRARRAFPDAELAFIPADARVAAWTLDYARALGRRADSLLAPVPDWCLWAGKLRDWTRRAKLALILLDALLRARLSRLGQAPGVDAAPAPKRPVSVGIASLGPREFKTPERWLTALIDGERIRAEDALFILQFKPSAAERATLQRLGLRAVEPYAFPLPVPRAAWERTAAAAPAALRALLAAPSWAAEVSVYAVKDHLLWTALLERWAPREFVTYDAEFSFRQNLRNALLKQAGTRTWFYASTVNVDALYMARSWRNAAPQPLYGYLDYDVFVGWAEELWPAPKTYFHLHRPRIGSYVFVGCLWAEQIAALRLGGGLPLKDRLQAAGYDPARHKLAAAFDCSFMGTVNTYGDGTRYARDLLRFLDEHPDLFLAWKEKRERSWTEARSQSLSAAYRALESHPRCLFTGHRVSAAEVLALCDLAVSFPFTSPTIEGLCARVPALYYDPTLKYRDSWFDRFPSLVAHGYEEFQALAEEWLYRTSPERAAAHFEHHVKGGIDPFLDGRALTRLRGLLAGDPLDSYARKEAARNA